MNRQRENNRTTCKLGCGTTIHFIRSVRWDKMAGIYKAGSYIPCETTLLTGDYLTTLVLIWPVEMRGRVVPNADEDMQGFMPHFANCKVYQDQQKAKALARQNRVVQASLF